VIITLSRQIGSNGDAIAARVAVELGLELVDRAYVHAAALAAGIGADLLQRLMYEGQRSVAGEILQSLGAPRSPTASAISASSPLLGVFAPMASAETADLNEAAKAMGQVVRNIAGRGNVLILGQGGQALLQGDGRACHVLILAPIEVRVARLAEREGLKLAEARRQVRSSDEARREYLDRYHNSRWLDPFLYHLVVNTGSISPEGAASLVIEAAQIVAGAAEAR
jgi:cytidylate kinase